MDTKKIDRHEIMSSDQDGEETVPLFRAPPSDEEDTIPNFNTLPFFSVE